MRQGREAFCHLCDQPSPGPAGTRAGRTAPAPQHKSNLSRGEGPARTEMRQHHPKGPQQWRRPEHRLLWLLC